MKKLVEDGMVFIIAAAIPYCAVSVAALAAGIMGAQERKHDRWKGKTPCIEQPINFEMLFPAYKIGCWIGAKQGEKYYWSKQ